MTSRLAVPILLAVFVLLALPAVRPSGDATLGQTAAKRPVYVRDFLFDSPPKAEQGAFGLPQGPVRRLFEGRPPSEDAAEHARRLANLLSKTIADHLTKEGYSARRIGSDETPPPDGWLVGGEFMDVDEGNRLRRAVIGFGAGSSDVKVQVEIFDLARDPNSPVMTFGADKASRKMPGEEMAIASKNPYAIAARYVMSRRATEHEIEKLGKDIASDLVKIAQSPESER